MLRDIISKRESELPPSVIGNLLKTAAENKNIISLGPGEPDFLPPSGVIASLKRNASKATHYAPPEGVKALRAAVAKKLRSENSIRADADNVIITNGSNESIMIALMCTIDPGEEVLVPDPGFMDYRPVVEILNGFPAPYRISEDENFEVNPGMIKEAVNPGKTKAIILNTPANPTGKVLKKKTLEELADIAVDNNLLIISDEAYEKFVYGKSKHISIASLNGVQENVVTLQSFSKTYAMTGFRVGYSYGPGKIIEAMKKVHVYTSISAPTLSQMAAIEALKTKKSYIEKARRDYEKRGSFLHQRLGEMGLGCVVPEGAFYLFPSIKNFKLGSEKFAQLMMDKAKVAMLPGTEFGRYGEGFVRLSYATAYEKIIEAADRMEKAAKNISRL
ncbi:MAG: aminotransferase class I/II-fold pyridoxal phosphate-dependent enzyme [Candidatus Aenigmarchaeota archaeon]|nr:aminotransferase class I/II-fold pyridoxal phosphate-dependent enzyme [Candidatus Aenigmarchaeota archaeon]